MQSNLSPEQGEMNAHFYRVHVCEGVLGACVTEVRGQGQMLFLREQHHPALETVFLALGPQEGSPPSAEMTSVSH